MRWFSIACLLLPLIIADVKAEWSWGTKSSDQTDPDITERTTELLAGEESPKQGKPSETNSTVLDDIVDELVSSPQGRSLGGFDDVYNDPTFKEALEAGDDTETRNLIKDRLCTLGLVQCDEEETKEKRTFVSPDQLIYAQPVDIKPVGQPIASIAVRGPPRAYGYGPPKPMNFPLRPQKVPPKRVGYGGNNRPGFSDKYSVSGSNYQFAQSNGLYNGNEGNYVTRPPTYAQDSPYSYENTKPSYNKVPAPSQQPIKSESIVQQHVHHHFVHSDGDKDPKVIIKPVAIPVGSIGNLAPQTLHQQQSDIVTAGGDYSEINSGGFKPMTGSFTYDKRPVYEPDTVYGAQYGQNIKGGGSQSLPNHYVNNAFEDQKYGNSLGAYNTQNSEFYKKELNVGSENNFYNQGPATFGQSEGFQESYHEGKAQNFDCVCVPYDQCPSQEIIGRRDDLYLPIDPRNKGSEIVALTDEQLDNITKIEAPVTEIVISRNVTESKTKTVSKREVKEEKETDDATKQIEARRIGPPGPGGYYNKQVQPTFGVSFGLPQPSYGGYPINPFQSNPVYNPYGPALNGGGINLGLVSVNPLLALQVTKNDYGEKVIKPLVNLHVTPNENVVNKIGNLFQDKKAYLLNKHEHYHHHIPYEHYNHKPLIPYSEYNPHVLQSPYTGHQRPPVYSSHYPHPNEIGYTKYNSDNVLASTPDEDYYDDSDNRYNDNDYGNPYQSGYFNPGFERSANFSDNNKQTSYANRYAYSRSLTLPSQNPGANRGSQRIRFPESRKKRDINDQIPSETIEERQGYFGRPPVQQCRSSQVCCRRPLRPQAANRGQCGIRHSQGINGRIKTPSYVDGDSEFGEYPWQAAILKKDPKDLVYVCGGTLIDGLHIATAAHCVKSYKPFELRVFLGEWDVNNDDEFYPNIKRDVISVHVHPLYYAGTLDNDLAILKLEHPVEWTKYPHVSPACLPDKYTDYSGQRCWTTGWGKDAFGDRGKFQNILKEVDVPVIPHNQCEQQLKQTRLGYNYELKPGFMCAGGEEGKDACKGDGGGPLVCERGGTWQLVGVVSWGIGCGQPGVPGVYVKVSHYLDWISQVTGKFSQF